MLLSSPSALPHDADATFPFPSYNTDSQPTMARPHNTFDIVLASHHLYLRGTGVDVEPATLQGSVVLSLVEATPFKEITMQLRGKARVPNMQSETSSVLGGSGYQTSVFFTHDWSFLEGARKHTPTLKAGRHVFPFQLQLEGALPSSLVVHGGLAGISYKLRATAVRPVFAANLHAAASVRVMRSFAPEALEYQQTLEVENTWPDKLMYSLMVPHKAWAAGDTVSTLVKFSPLLKGVRIIAVTSTVQEHMKTYNKTGAPHEQNRTITMASHEFRDGHAITTQLTDPGKTRRATPPWSTPNSPSPLSPASEGIRTPALDGRPPLDPFSAGAQQLLSGVPIIGTPPPGSGARDSPSTSEAERAPASEAPDLGDEEIVTALPLMLPVAACPSHALEPIVVSHRIRWSILMSNPDGHTSELRCSLPLCILDHMLLDEARLATGATRRLLFGLDATQSGRPEMELPSYPAHVLDRVANAYLPASPRSRVPSLPLPLSASPPTTPGDVALDWVNAELHRRVRARPGSVPTPPDSAQTSRHSSRAGSPERGVPRDRHHHHSIFSLKPFTKVAASLHPALPRHPSADGASGSALPSPLFPRGTAEDEARGQALLNRAFNEVPRYDVASRGFLGGGVTPLSSTRGLPSYEEAERSQSDGDLAARFAAARTCSTSALHVSPGTLEPASQ